MNQEDVQAVIGASGWISLQHKAELFDVKLTSLVSGLYNEVDFLESSLKLAVKNGFYLEPILPLSVIEIVDLFPNHIGNIPARAKLPIYRPIPRWSLIASNCCFRTNGKNFWEQQNELPQGTSPIELDALLQHLLLQKLANSKFVFPLCRTKTYCKDGLQFCAGMDDGHLYIDRLRPKENRKDVALGYEWQLYEASTARANAAALREKRIKEEREKAALLEQRKSSHYLYSY